MSSIGFRRDINSLRAIAVIGVLIFHFMPQVLPGGYAGVDVFFVISGYLMTAIIFRELEQGIFSAWKFYYRRAIRIIPALIALCATLLVLGWAFLDPLSYRELSKHALGSLLFISNIVYWREAGYFDASSHEKWLLHTWSLSVEWQFYLIYPLIVLILVRTFRRDQIPYVFAALALGSFLVSCLWASQMPTSAFYMLPSRVWEMMAGAMVHLSKAEIPEKHRKTATYFGIFLISLSYITFDDTLLWPAPLALIPVVGTSLVILSNLRNSPVIDNRFLQMTGRTSYSLYLWHWPFVVMGNYLMVHHDYLFIICGLLASFLLGWASFVLIERRIKAHQEVGTIGSLLRSGISVGTLAALIPAGAVLAASGVPGRVDDGFARVTTGLALPSRENGYCFYNVDGLQEVSRQGTKCIIGDSEKKPVGLLIGDSFAAQYEPFWDVVARRKGIALDAVTTNWCYPSFSGQFISAQSQDAHDQCHINRSFLADAARNYNFIILSGHWRQVLLEEQLDDVMAAAKRITEAGVSVIIMPSPVIYDTDIGRRFRFALFNNIPFSLDSISRRNDDIAQEANDRLKVFAETVPNVRFISRETIFSNREAYRKAGRLIPFSLDGDHISLEASKILGFRFLRRHPDPLSYMATSFKVEPQPRPS